MRKIEKAMVAAVNGRYNWAESNTQVICSSYPDDNHTKVYVERIYLHGHEIAYRDNGKFFVVVNTLKEWNTRTTRSRLYALGFTKKPLTH